MEIMTGTQKAEADAATSNAKPYNVSDQPAQPNTGKVTDSSNTETDQPKLADAQSAVDKAKERIRARAEKVTGQNRAAAAGTSAQGGQTGATTGNDKTGEVTAADIAKAEKAAADLAEANAALGSAGGSATPASVPASGTSLEQLQKLVDADPSILTELIKKVTGTEPGKADDSPAAQIAKLQAELEAANAEIATKTKAAQDLERANTAKVEAERNKLQVIASILEEDRFSALKTRANVEAAFEETRRAANLIMHEKGRKLTDTEADKLTEHFLLKHQKMHAEKNTVTSNTLGLTGNVPVKSGLATGQPKTRRSLEQVKKDLRAMRQ